jgi:hypothetical protein
MIKENPFSALSVRALCVRYATGRARWSCSMHTFHNRQGPSSEVRVENATLKDSLVLLRITKCEILAWIIKVLPLLQCKM